MSYCQEKLTSQKIIFQGSLPPRKKEEERAKNDKNTIHPYVLRLRGPNAEGKKMRNIGFPPELEKTLSLGSLYRRTGFV